MTTALNCAIDRPIFSTQRFTVTVVAVPSQWPFAGLIKTHILTNCPITTRSRLAVCNDGGDGLCTCLAIGTDFD